MSFVALSLARIISALVRCCVVLVMFLPSLASASANDWLLMQQNPDGSIVGNDNIATPFQATADSLQLAAVRDVAGTQGLGFLVAQLQQVPFAQTEYLGRYFLIASEAGLPVTDVLSELSGRQNSDGGLGGHAGYASTPLDTAFALQALALADSPINTKVSGLAVGFLLEHQLDNGGWQDGANEASVYVTAQVLLALWHFRELYTAVPAALTAGQNFLLSRRDAHGLWPETFETALAMLAILPQMQDVVLLTNSADALRQLQEPNGSWGDDVYKTALIARALQAYDRQANQDARSAPVAGYVLKALTSEPVPGATVTIQQVEGVVIQTNDEGYYVFPTLSAGDYTVVANKSGYLPASTGVSTTVGKTTLAGNLVLAQAPQQGLVSGRVFTATDVQPLPGVSVTLTGSASYTQASDVAGQFDLGTIEPGDYTLSISKEGYYPVTGTVSVVAGQQLQINQGLNREGAYQDAGPADIYGRIVDGQTGLGLAGVSIELDTGLMTRSDTNGDFRVFAVPRGDYSVAVTATDYQAARLSLVFPAGASGHLGTLSLYPLTGEVAATTLSLQGLVVDGVTQAPLVGADITLPGLLLSATSDAEGRFVIGAIPETSFQVLIAVDGYSAGDFTIQADGFGQMNARFSLSPPGDGGTSTTLSGVVTDQVSGLPVSGARLQIEGTDLSVLTDVDGAYGLSGITDRIFTLSVSAVGYVSQTRSLQLEAFGHYSLDPTLTAIAGEAFQVLSVQAIDAPWPAAGTALFTTEITSIGTQARQVQVIGEVVNSAGTSVATVSAYDAEPEGGGSQFSFYPGETRTLTLPWFSGQFAPGVYTLIVRVIEPWTITRDNPRGVILAEGSGSGLLRSTMMINGVLDMDPPLTQAGSTTPVTLLALIRNAGNTPLDAASYRLVIRDPNSGEDLYVAGVSGLSLAVGQYTEVDFGQWLPTAIGNLDVIIKSPDSAIEGSIGATLYVGDTASGHFHVDRSIVPAGDATVHGQIDLQGVDVSAGISTDPLFALLKDSAERASGYVSREAVAWHKRGRCYGCHIQSQSLMGLTSAMGKVDVDPSAVRFLGNVMTTGQQRDGTIRRDTGARRISSYLNTWGLSAWSDKESEGINIRALYKSAESMLHLKNQSGDRVSWYNDWGTAWFYGDEGATALNIRSLARLLSQAEKMDITHVKDHTLDQRFWAGPTMGPMDIEFGHDGHLYMIKWDDDINHRWYPSIIQRKNLSDGSIAEVASLVDTKARGLAVADDGALFVTTQNKGLLRINGDGSETLLLKWGIEPLELNSSLFDVELGPDELLYVSDFTQHQIIRLDQQGHNIEVIARDGLLNSPKGLAFDNSGKLLISNAGAYNILKLDPDTNSISVHSDGLYKQPQWLAVDSQDQVFASSWHSDFNLYRILPNGQAEVMHFEANDWLKVFQSVAVNPNTDQVYAASYYGNNIKTIKAQMLDTSRLSEMRDVIAGAARYLLSKGYSSRNTTHASVLVGLAEARPFIEDTLLLQQIDSAILSKANLLRSTQRSDGGWEVFNNYNAGSDPLTTAYIGLALDYTNPDPDDPVIRHAIEFLLSTQAEDGSWYNVSNELTSRLAATSFVMAYLPRAMERLGGISIDLHLITKDDVQLHNASHDVVSIMADEDGNIHRTWEQQGVTASGQSLSFDMDLIAVQLNEQRPVATEAWLTFNNDFTYETLRVDLDIPVVTARSGIFVTLSTDRSVYQANDTVQIISQINNTSPMPVSATLPLAIHASGSEAPLAVLPEVDITDLVAGEQRSLVGSWFTDGTYFGDFEIVAQLLDTSGLVLDENRTALTIEKPASLASVSLSTDKPRYNAWDVVEMSSRVRNMTGNAQLSNSLLELKVTDPDGGLIYSERRHVKGLSPEALSDQAFALVLNDAVAGDYQVEIMLKDDFGQHILASNSTVFVIERHVLQGLVARIDVNSTSVYAGDLVSCADTVTNLSTTAINDLELHYQVANVETGVIVEDAPVTLAALAGGDSHWSGRDIDSAQLGLGGFACMVKAALNGKQQLLAYGGFTVLEPPIRIAAEFAVAGRGRVLVLLDPECEGLASLCRPSNDSVNVYSNSVVSGSAVMPERDVLYKMLAEGGWSSQFVDNAEDFSRGLHSGAYSHFVMLSSQIEISELDQRLLREVIFNGAGLLVSGIHDRRNAWLQSLLGVSFTGISTDVLGVETISPVLGGAQQLLFSAPDKVNRITLDGAEILAGFMGADVNEGVAMSKNQYGYGQIVHVGFDLLKHVAMSMSVEQQDHWGELISKLINLSHPENISFTPGRVIPVIVKLSNDGVATSGRVLFDSSAEIDLIDVVDSGAGDMTATNILNGYPGVEWQYTLIEGEVRVLVLWIRLPDEPGLLSLWSQIQTSEVDEYTDYGDVMMLDVTVDPPVNIDDIVVSVQQLDIPPSNLVLTMLIQIDSALAGGDVNQAVRLLLVLTELLARDYGVNAENIRYQLDDLLQRLMQKMP